MRMRMRMPNEKHSACAQRVGGRHPVEPGRMEMKKAQWKCQVSPFRNRANA
jgi:hypothetical protein